MQYAARKINSSYEIFRKILNDHPNKKHHHITLERTRAPF